MAAAGGTLPPEPPDKNQEVVFKCHPKAKVITVMCVVCDNVYHKTDFDRYKDGKYIGKALVICPEHVELLITLKDKDKKIKLDEKARIVIALLKSEKEEKIKQKILDEISPISDAIHKSVISEKLNATDLLENTELENLYAENQLLKKLNQELIDKNLLLKRLVKYEKNEEDISTLQNKKNICRYCK